MSKALHSVIEPSRNFKYHRPKEGIKKAFSYKPFESVITASTSNSRSNRRERTMGLSKSIGDQLKKAKEICQSVKEKINHKTSGKPDQTKQSVLSSFRENGKIVENNEILKILRSPQLILHLSAPKQGKLQESSSPKEQNCTSNGQITSLLSPRSKDSLHSLDEVREIESFCLEPEGEEREEVSIVEGHGLELLDWGVCVGRAGEFRVLQFLDEGKYGKVCLAQSHRNNFVYSVKSIYRSSLDESSLLQLIREVKIQAYLSHPHIVRLYNFFVDDDSAHLVLEPCLGRNLYQNLKEAKRVPEKTVREWMRQICSAVQFMHRHDIIHRDLKPENILLHENQIKICDFGWAIHSPLLRTTQCGTPLYTPPELVSKSPYDSKIDIWSIGVLTYELLYGTIPFEIRQLSDMVKIIQQDVYFSREGGVSEAAKDFMIRCLEKNPLERASIQQLLDHQFLWRTEKFRLTLV